MNPLAREDILLELVMRDGCAGVGIDRVGLTVSPLVNKHDCESWRGFQADLGY